jgi:hypothetical protein
LIQGFDYQKRLKKFTAGKKIKNVLDQNYNLPIPGHP